ncbi:Holliday junction resolvase RuvX [Candidatus Daviesbacteria bacterium]|nr:Holliday junction resolvase RuvX [Candidatus Daviesbacteria bacterium]
MKYLGIDYGKKKIGIAISEGEMAEPFMILEISSLKDALGKVIKIINDEGIEEVVIGMPESGEAKKITENFIELLSKHVKVIESEETLSSQKAQKMMADLGIPKNKRGDEDSYAAAYILQDYLDNLTMSS